MKIDIQQVKKIARLARLSQEASEDFLLKHQKELGQILLHVNQLVSLNPSDINLPVRTVGIEELREDVPRDDQNAYQAVQEKIIQNFPRSQNRLLILPGIFHDN